MTTTSNITNFFNCEGIEEYTTGCPVPLSAEEFDFEKNFADPEFYALLEACDGNIAKAAAMYAYGQVTYDYVSFTTGKSMVTGEVPQKVINLGQGYTELEPVDVEDDEAMDEADYIKTANGWIYFLEDSYFSDINNFFD